MKKKTLQTILLMFCLIFLISGCGSKSESTPQEAADSQEETTPEETAVESDDTAEDEEEIEVIYPDNKVINYFLVKYNSLYPDEALHDGDFFKYSHHGKTEDDRIHFYEEKHEILVSGPGGMFAKDDDWTAKVSIDYRPKVDSDAEDFKIAFFKYARVFNPELTDDTLEEYWEEIVRVNDSVNGVQFDEFKCTIDDRITSIVSVTISGNIKQ